MSTVSGVAKDQGYRFEDDSEEGCRLLEACRTGDVEEVRRLASVVDVNGQYCFSVRSPDKLNPLAVACGRGNLELARCLIDEFGAEVHPEGVELPPICFACTGQDVELVELLVNGGADVNWTGDWGYQGEQTLLGIACIEGTLEIVQLLVDAGADINAAAGDKHTTPFKSAWDRAHNSEVARFLIEKGAQFDANQLVKEFVFEKVSFREYIPTVEMMQAMADREMIPSQLMKLPLEVWHFGEAAEERFNEVRAIMGDQVDSLYWACFDGDLEAARAAFDSLEGNAAFGTPLQLAAARGHHEVCEFLLQKAIEHEHKNRLASCSYLVISQGGTLDTFNLFQRYVPVPQDANFFEIAWFNLHRKDIGLALLQAGAPARIDDLAWDFVHETRAERAPTEEMMQACLRRGQYPTRMFRFQGEGEKEVRLREMIQEAKDFGDWVALMTTLNNDKIIS